MCVCVVCVVCGLCGVCGAAWHAEEPPCVGSKRLRVLVQNASACTGKTRAYVEHMRAFCRHTRKRFEPTHGEEGGVVGVSRPFFFLSHVVLFIRSLSLSLLFSLFSSLFSQ